MVPDSSIYGFLHRQLPMLFPDAMFADLFTGTGRRSVPPSVVAAVMVLQRLEGLSVREAVDRFTFDARWRYTAGVGGWDGPVGCRSRTPCSWTCGSGCAAPIARTGSSRWPWPRPGKPGWSVG